MNEFRTFLPLDRVTEAAWRLYLYGGDGPTGHVIGLRDQLRDRRTVFMIVVLPLILYPALGAVGLQFALVGTVGKPSTIDLTPNLDFQPAGAMQGTLEEELEQLRLAIDHYEVLARERIHQLRGGGGRP